MTEGLARRHRIHGVQPVLPVPDVAAAADWYCGVLGFEIDFLHGDPPVHGRVRLGTERAWGDAVFIHLAHRPGVEAPSQVRLHVGHDIDGLHAHVLRAGATVTAPPSNQPWGLREMVLLAPGGHVLVLGAEA